MESQLLKTPRTDSQGRRTSRGVVAVVGDSGGVAPGATGVTVSVPAPVSVGAGRSGGTVKHRPIWAADVVHTRILA